MTLAQHRCPQADQPTRIHPELSQGEPWPFYPHLGYEASSQSGSRAYRGASGEKSAPEKWDVATRCACCECLRTRVSPQPVVKQAPNRASRLHS